MTVRILDFESLLARDPCWLESDLPIAHQVEADTATLWLMSALGVDLLPVAAGLLRAGPLTREQHELVRRAIARALEIVGPVVLRLTEGEFRWSREVWYVRADEVDPQRQRALSLLNEAVLRRRRVEFEITDYAPGQEVLTIAVGVLALKSPVARAVIRAAKRKQ